MVDMAKIMALNGFGKEHFIRGLNVGLSGVFLFSHVSIVSNHLPLWPSGNKR